MTESRVDYNRLRIFLPKPDLVFAHKSRHAGGTSDLIRDVLYCDLKSYLEDDKYKEFRKLVNGDTIKNGFRTGLIDCRRLYGTYHKYLMDLVDCYWDEPYMVLTWDNNKISRVECQTESGEPC